ncbi:hypothetical protein ACHAWO_001958 [Cyclotella atomus]|uniref:WRKY19-like zinc finger domain-containing protein n=1 Tax=Cyclotella atomus TaxID=382360 RepID=A0ABD3QDT3_9STRA
MSLPLSGISFIPVPSALVANIGKDKPAKRSCSIAGCTNGIVQGGLCVSHGAKRRKCQFPGCDKSSKAAGMCSKHGPKRKACDEEGCTAISVRGTKCKAHAEPSKKCAVGGCRKAASVGGICKRHHGGIDNALPSLPGLTGMPPLCMPAVPMVQVPLSHAIAAQQNMLSMRMAGLPYANPLGMHPSYFGLPGAGLGFGGMGALNYDTASLLASRRMGEAATSDALMMLDLANTNARPSDEDSP